MHHRPGDHEALGHAARVPVDLDVGLGIESELLEHGGGPGVAVDLAEAVIGGMKGQVLAGSERAVEVAPLRNHRQHPLGLDRIIDHIDPGHSCLATGRLDPGGEDADRGGLAGSIGTEEAKDLAACDGER